jgi:hypothetical protein
MNIREHIPTLLIPHAPLHPSLKLRMTKKASRDRLFLLTQGRGNYLIYNIISPLPYEVGKGPDSYREGDGYIYF